MKLCHVVHFLVHTQVVDYIISVSALGFADMGSLESVSVMDELRSQSFTCSHNHPKFEEVATSFPQAALIRKYDFCPWP